MNNKLKILTLFFVIIFLYSCQTAQEALQGKKRSEQGDEFLVQKKNPLTLPPDFEKLPIPGQDEESLYSDEKSEVKNLLIENKEEDNTFQQNKTGSLEDSILEKIQ